LSQYNFGNLTSPTPGTVLVDTHLEPWRDALHTMHSGSSRPSYAVAGMMWLDTTTTPWVVKMFDGSDDISLGTVNAATNLFAAANAASSANPTLTGTITGSAAPKINNFRLTLTPNVPVTTSDVTGASTLYLTPYNGNQIALYNGTTWELLTTAQVSLALSGLTSGRPYDVFAWNNAGTVTLETLVWTNDTTRATALAYQDGVLVRSGSTTRRYLGTFYSTGTTTTEDSAANRYLWNYYHRAKRPMTVFDATASWTYSTLAWRQANGSTANQMNFVIGVSEDAVFASLMTSFSNSTATVRTVFNTIQLDGTNGATGFTFAGSGQTGTSLYNITNIGEGIVSAGRHFLAWLEYGAGVDTQTWHGGNARGIMGSLFA
jgi:hypothetical protein